MKHSQIRNKRRRGFTLIELLIVLVIIGILLSLIGAAVIKALSVGRRTDNRLTIGQLELALGQFKQRYGSYPLSILILCENYDNYFVGNIPNNLPLTKLHADSVAFLSKMFPNCLNSWSISLGGKGIDWNGNNVLDAPVLLEGDQCLVFFLGGIPSACPAGNLPLNPLGGANNPLTPATAPPACLGFAADPSNPANPNSTDRIYFYDFKSSRLALFQQSALPNPVRSQLHYSYLDAYGQSDGYGKPKSGMPYAFFSSNRGTSAYCPYILAGPNAGNYSNTPQFAPLSSDCLTLGAINDALLGLGPLNPQGLWPYAEVTFFGNANAVPIPIRFLNKDSFQIISAGADQIFGSGSVSLFNTPANIGQNGFSGFTLTWTPASSLYPVPQQGTMGIFGLDDQSNFSSGILGANDQ